MNNSLGMNSSRYKGGKQSNSPYKNQKNFPSGKKVQRKENSHFPYEDINLKSNQKKR